MELNPSDLDKNQSLENLTKINIDQFVRQVNKDLKRSLLESRLETIYGNLSLTTTRTRFEGSKYWFICPKCLGRAGTLYLSENLAKFICRKCQRILYYKQKYKYSKFT